MYAIDEVKVLERRLRNYTWYKQEQTRLTNEIEVLFDMLGASPKSPSWGSEPIHSPKNIEREYQTREDIEKLTMELETTNKELEYLDSVLVNAVDSLQKPMQDIYIKGKSINSVRKQYGYSYGGLYKALHNELKRIIVSGKIISN